MSRFDAISSVLSNIKKEDILIATTGKTARELYLLKKKQNKLQSDLLVVVYGACICNSIRCFRSL